MDAIEKLVRETELKKLQLQLMNMFNANIEVFRKRFPSIYKTVESHKVTNVQLRLDASNRLNLFDSANKAWFYSNNPAEYAQAQTQQFLAQGGAAKLRLAPADIYNDEHIHIPYTNRLIEQLSNCTDKHRTFNRDHFNTLILSGLGLGYQIPEFMKNAYTHNLFVYEPNIDVFHASLHTIDWNAVIDHFTKEGRSITFCLGVSTEQALEQVEKAVSHHGLFNYVYAFISQHTTRKEELDFIAAYKKNVSNYVGSLGFFDDEQIGLAHGYANLQNGSTFFNNAKAPSTDIPIMVVGNGPSLDAHKDYLKSVQNKAVIMSCGTALASLANLGVHPHLHVETERVIGMQDFIKHGTDEAFRKGITLLCLHTVPPGTINLFEHSALALKPHDTALPVMQAALKGLNPAVLGYCNPTVANCGLSFAVSMGFKNIHLIGTDFGIGSKGEHHAKVSTHYELQEKASATDSFTYDYQDDNDIFVAGNFGGTVKSHHTLNLSRVVIERYLSIVKRVVPDLKTINSNNGAYIEGTEPTEINELPEYPEVDIARQLEAIKAIQFSDSSAEELDIADIDTLLSYFFSIQAQLKLKPKINSEKELLNELRRVFLLVSEDKDRTTHLLLRGSINTFFGIIAEHCFYLSDANKFQSMYEIARSTFNEFIDRAYEKMQENALTMDQTRSQLFSNLK